MYEKHQHLLWVGVLLVVSGCLWGCEATGERVSGATGRRLTHGVTALHHNHLLQPSGSSESVKLAPTGVGQHVPFVAAWRLSPTVGTPLAVGWGMRRPLAKPSVGPAASPGRSRINNRSMTRFAEVEIPAGLEPQLAAPEPASSGVDPTEATGLMELYRSAERSRGIEDFFWKYFVDNDVSASISDDDDDDDNEVDGEQAGGKDEAEEEGDRNEKFAGTALQTAKTPEGRKKKFHIKKKYKKFLIPLLLAYKIKFLALVPAIIGGLILLVKAAGLAGFFFALFTAVVSLKKY
ncbi:uncharacterized protein LOC128721259 [Anopheles nili]|uniref:uncharacterized protein LOC128721259 n=1 Tax=Anopheles nili TaxID=185578 RepID=UPI00237BA896|nr:uncharacterized protein LOC128721259 [Anopheles nili]